MNKINLDVGVVRRMMREHGLGFDDLGRKLGTSGLLVVAVLNKGEASPELAVRMAQALGTTITEISTA